MNSLISIIIPTYNRAHLIEENLNSILRQSYTNWECILVDDGSTDNTETIINKYVLNDIRINYYQRPKERPKGANACRNYGFEFSKGEYINWFDSDDLMHPEKLKKDLESINKGDFDFTLSQSDFFDHSSNKQLGVWNDTIWSKDPLNDFILKKIGWGINSPLWKKESLIKKQLKFDERLQNGQDYLYHIQALVYQLKPCVNDKILVHQRHHSDKIENNIYKSPSKSIILNYLLKNYNAINYNKSTRKYLLKKTIPILINLYKTKHWKNALLFSKQLIDLPESRTYIMKLIKLFFVGTFYKITTKGYQFIK